VIQILYGTTATGIAASGDVLIGQGTAGMNSVAEDGDGFGAALAVGDLENKDSAHDLVVGAPGEDLTGAADAGAVHLLYGGDAAGLTTASAWALNQSSPKVATGNGPGDRFGAALAIGDFGGNEALPAKDQPTPSFVSGDADTGDVAIGVPGESFGGLDDVGAVVVVYGDAGEHGKAVVGQQWHQDVANVADTNEAGDKFGSVLAAAHYKGSSGPAGLSIGVPGESAGNAAGPGGLAALYGTGASGLVTTGSQRWTQGTASLQDAAEAGDAFGGALAP
jgi:hypothetical protein